MSRQEYAPKTSEIRITDLSKGLGEFRPKPDKAIFRAGLTETLKKAGYELREASVEARGVVERQGDAWYLRIPESKQRFELRGFTHVRERGKATLRGRWTTEGGTEVLTAPAE